MAAFVHLSICPSPPTLHILSPTLAPPGGPHLIIGDVLEHVISVLENKKMGVWLCMDYSQTLLHYILSVPYYILQLSCQSWEGEGSGGE